MQTWLRLYYDAATNIKLSKLSDRDHRFLFNCWCLIGKNGGTLPPAADVAWELRLPIDVVAQIVQTLVDAGLLEITTHGIVAHNWQTRQYISDNSTSRVRAFRERKRLARTVSGNVSGNVSATVSPSVSVSVSGSSFLEESTNTGKISTRARAVLPPVKGMPTDGKRWAEFQARYPFLGDVDRACQTYISVVTAEDEPALFACLERYLASKLVADGFAKEAWKWLEEQKRGSWNGTWPAAKNGTNGPTFTDEDYDENGNLRR